MNYASFFQRLIAHMVDSICFSLILFLLIIAGVDVESIPKIVISAVLLLYFSLMESSSRQATIGKWAMQLKVTDEHGNRLSFLRALARILLKIISYSILIGFFPILFTSKRQALHDIIAKTLVIQDKSKEK